MSKHSIIAEQNFMKGYNCAQSVVLAFCDVTGMDEQTALRASSSFGGGMGKLREVCGAVSGMFLVAGLLYGYTNPEDADAKTAHNQMLQDLAKKFKEKNGSIICRELLKLQEEVQTPVPQERTVAYYHGRPCAALVAHAAELLDEVIDGRS